MALFGIEGEHGTGRLHLLENNSKEHDKRLKKIERWQIALTSAGFVVLWMVNRLEKMLSALSGLKHLASAASFSVHPVVHMYTGL